MEYDRVTQLFLSARRLSFNKSSPKQNGRHFADGILKWIFLNENVWISINISLHFIHRDQIGNIPVLVWIMAWRRPVDKPLSEPIMFSLLTHTYVTLPQWVKIVKILHVLLLWMKGSYKNTERHTAHTIVSWPNPKQWVIVHASDLMMIIRESIYILSIITREMGKLKTHSPTCCIMDNWENMPYPTHTLDKMYLTGIL